MGMRASLSAASEFGRSAVGRKGLVRPALAATAITLVLASCSASSPFSNASQTASYRCRRIIQQHLRASRLTPHHQPARLPQRDLRRSRITRIRYHTRSNRSRTCSAVRLKRKQQLKTCRIRPAHTRLPISLTLHLPLNRLTAHPCRVRLPPRRRLQMQIPPTRCRIPNNRCLSFSRNSRAPPNSRSGLLHPVATRKGAWLSGDDPLSIR